MITPNRVVLAALFAAFGIYALVPSFGIGALLFLGAGYWAGRRKGSKEVMQHDPVRSNQSGTFASPLRRPRIGADFQDGAYVQDIASALMNLGCKTGKAWSVAKHVAADGGTFDQMLSKALREAA